MLVSPAPTPAAQWTLQPRASVQGEYTDNLFLTPDNEKDDYLITTSVGLTAGVAGQTAEASFSYDPSYAWYDEYAENNGWRHNASLLAGWDISKNTRLDFSDYFVHTEDPLSEQEIDVLRGLVPPPQADTTVRIDRRPYSRNVGRLALNHRFGEYDRVFADYSYTTLNNEDDVNYEDSQGHRAGAGITYYFTFRWGFDLNGNYTRGTFDQDNEYGGTPTSDFENWGGNIRLLHRFTKNLEGYIQYTHNYQAFTDETQNDYHVYAPSIGIDYAIQEDIQFLASGGYSVRKFEDAAREELFQELDRGSGWTFNLDLIKTLRRGFYRLTASSGYDQTYFTNQNLGFTRYYLAGLTADYEIFRRFYGDIFGFYRRNEYEDPDQDELERLQPQRQDDVYRAGVGLAYTPTRWMRIRAGYSYRNLESTRPENDYIENRGTLTFSFAPDQPYRF